MAAHSIRAGDGRPAPSGWRCRLGVHPRRAHDGAARLLLLLVDSDDGDRHRDLARDRRHRPSRIVGRTGVGARAMRLGRKAVVRALSLASPGVRRGVAFSRADAVARHAARPGRVDGDVRDCRALVSLHRGAALALQVPAAAVPPGRAHQRRRGDEAAPDWATFTFLSRRVLTSPAARPRGAPHGRPRPSGRNRACRPCRAPCGSARSDRTRCR